MLIDTGRKDAKPVERRINSAVMQDCEQAQALDTSQH